MLKMDGIETLRRIRETDKKVKVIIFSGYINDMVKEDAKDLNISQYFHKPFDGDQLFQMINKISFI